jgi:hypothetical protein
MKVETQFKDQGVTINDTQAITMPGEASKDQIVIPICKDLIEIHECKGLQEYLPVIPI